MIFLDELYARDGSRIYGIHSWLLFALEVARHFEETLLLLTLREPSPPGWPLVADLAGSGIRLAPLPPYPSLTGSLLRLPWVAATLRRHLGEVRQATAVLIRVPSVPGLLLAEMARHLGVRFGLYVCANLETQAGPIVRQAPGLFFWRRLARGLTNLTRIAARGNLVFTVGEELAAIFGENRGWLPPPEAVVNLPDHMHSSESLYERDDTCQGPVVRLLRVCQLFPSKGLEVLLHSLKRLADQELPVELDVVGGGPPEYQSRLEELARQLGLASRVRFRGALAYGEVLTLYRQADLQVISSYGEGIPRVIMEGWSASLPLVATAVGGIPGVVRHDENGLLVPPGDPEALAAALQRLIQDRSLRRRLVQKGFAQARKNSREQQAAKLAAILKGQGLLSPLPKIPGKGDRR